MSKQGNNSDALILLLLLLSIALPAIAWQEPDLLPSMIVGFCQYGLPVIGLGAAWVAVSIGAKGTEAARAYEAEAGNSRGKQLAYKSVIGISIVLFIIRVLLRFSEAAE